MSLSPRLVSSFWIICALGATGFLAWSDWQREQHVEYVSSLDREGAMIDATSPTGYAGGRRWLIVPEHNSRTYQWIAETQQMLAHGEWRVRWTDADNAPAGRAVHAASLTRWWLALIAWCDRGLSGRPLGLAVERAALVADPVLHLLLLLAAGVCAARWFGGKSAALMVVGWTLLFPLAATYLPGVIDIHGAAAACAFWSVLPLVAGAGGAARAVSLERATAGGRFFFAGVAGGVGLWLSAGSEALILAGLGLGALLSAWLKRRRARDLRAEQLAPLPWRIWALGGAGTCLAAYLIEYFPAGMALRLQVNHPLYGLAWIGLGEVLSLCESGFVPGTVSWNLRDVGRLTLAAGGVAALPVAMRLTRTPGFLAGDPLALRLTNLPDAVAARNLPVWIARDGLSVQVYATGLPVLLLALAVWLLWRRQTQPGPRGALALAFGPAAVALFCSVLQLRWWSLFDGALLALVPVAAAALVPAFESRRASLLGSGLVGLVFFPGMIPLWSAATAKEDLTRREVEGLIERQLAHWIADHAGPAGAVILAPPERTVSLCFYGGLRGIGTPNWENGEGLEAALRIVSATTADEAQALLGQRGIRYIILPSWDPDFDAFVRWTLRRPEDSFLDAFEHWKLPPWLRPLPYQLPTIAGFEGQSLVVLEVTDEGNRAIALGRLAEYFVEMHQIDLAMSAGLALRRYPANLGALVALAIVDKAREDTAGFTKDFDELTSMVDGGLDRALPWDRRVSLATVLAEGDRVDLARAQVQRCLDQLDAARIRSLTTASLYRLLVLTKTFDLKISDTHLQELALGLLPAELRSRL